MGSHGRPLASRSPLGEAGPRPRLLRPAGRRGERVGGPRSAQSRTRNSGKLQPGWAGPPGAGGSPPGKLKSRKHEIIIITTNILKNQTRRAQKARAAVGAGPCRVCVGPSVRVSARVCVSAARAGALTISPGERGHFGVGLEMLRLRLLPPRHAGSNISWGRIKNY